jgi:hypothetical protein
MEVRFNKALAGAPPEMIPAAREAATYEATTYLVVLDALALAISTNGGPPLSRHRRS